MRVSRLKFRRSPGYLPQPRAPFAIAPRGKFSQDEIQRPRGRVGRGLTPQRTGPRFRARAHDRGLHISPGHAGTCFVCRLIGGSCRVFSEDRCAKKDELMPAAAPLHQAEKLDQMAGLAMAAKIEQRAGRRRQKERQNGAGEGLFPCSRGQRRSAEPIPVQARGAITKPGRRSERSGR